MLTAEQAESLRTQLLGERRRLVASGRQALSFSKQRDRGRVGRDSLDESTEEELFSTQMRLADREQRLLTKIEAALTRLEGPEGDQCEECEEPIGYARLTARPVTTLCIQCKEDRERGQ